MVSVRGKDILLCAAFGTWISDCEVVIELRLETTLRRVSEDGIEARGLSERVGAEVSLGSFELDS